MTSPSSLSSSSEVSFPGKYSAKCTDASLEQTFLLSNLYITQVYSESDIHPLTKCLNQIVWDWTGGIFHPNFLTFESEFVTNVSLSQLDKAPPPSTCLAQRHTNWSPAPHLVSRDIISQESTTSSDNSSTKFVRTLTLTLTWIFWYTLVMEVKLKTDTCTRVKGTDIVEYHIRFLFICNSFQDTVGKGGSGQDSIDHSSSHFVRDPQYLAPWPRRRVLSPLTNCGVSNNKNKETIKIFDIYNSAQQINTEQSRRRETGNSLIIIIWKL